MKIPTLPLAARYHHLHLASNDAEASARWYARHLGGRYRATGDYQLALFENSFLIWYQSDDVAPSIGGVLDHFGFSVPSIDSVLEAMVTDGAELLQQPRAVGPEELRIAFVNDPWGTKVELLEDEELLGPHHVHLLVTDIEEHREWLRQRLGGTAESFKNLLPGLRFDGLWILYRQGEPGLGQSKGRAIDHLGFQVEDTEGATRALTDSGANLDGIPRDIGDLRVAFVTDGLGVRYELITPHATLEAT